MSTIIGFILIFTASFFQGSFYLPMTFTKEWEWENTWVVFSLFGMFVFNWMFVFLFIPNILSIYAATPPGDIFILSLFGITWGVGGILNGQAMHRLGMALAFPIIGGLTTSCGALLPIIVFFPSALFTPRGLALILGTGVTVIGIIMCSRAASDKQQRTESPAQTTGGSLAFNLAIAIAAGLFGSTLNIGLAFGESLVVEARKLGVSDAYTVATNWAVVFTVGCVINILYCLYLMVKRNTMKKFFVPETVRNTGLGVLMGFIWSGSLFVYGMGISFLGKWGIVVGWVLFLTTGIIVGNLWGIWRGEWKGAAQQARSLLNRGLLVLILAIVVVALSNTL
ncbi:L-rhamnose/proton symporter RhaT [Candidatus Latescibacterota bacterium]